jgi:hypothetical protein
MHKPWGQQREIGTTQRGHLIQRILVDGWTPAEAALLIGVEERRVRRWLADYRRHGMASLRGDLATDNLPRRWAAWLRARLSRLLRLPTMTQREPRHGTPAPCVILRHGGDDVAAGR